MKLALIVVLAVLVGPCGKKEPYPVPSLSPTPSPTLWPKPDAEWQGPFVWVGRGSEKYILVCRQSGKIIAEINSGANDPHWNVFGGDGNGYGEYVTKEQARAKADAVVTDSTLTHKLLRCP